MRLFTWHIFNTIWCCSLLWRVLSPHTAIQAITSVRRRTPKSGGRREGKMELDFGGKCISCVWHEVNEIILMMSNFRNGAFSSHFYRFKWGESARGASTCLVFGKHNVSDCLFSVLCYELSRLPNVLVHTYTRKIQFCVAHIDTDDSVMEYLKLGTALYDVLLTYHPNYMHICRLCALYLLLAPQNHIHSQRHTESRIDVVEKRNIFAHLKRFYCHCVKMIKGL